MTPGGAEALKAAVRRSIPLALLLIALGVLAVNGIRQYQGPRYAASSSVLISTSDLGSLLTGIQPPYVDPSRVEQTELALAQSPVLFGRVATEGVDASEVEQSVEATADDGILTFVVERERRVEAVNLANAVAGEFVRWRAELAVQRVREAKALLEREIAQSGETPALQQQLNQLEVLEAVSSGSAVRLEQATEAEQTSPAPVRDSVLGAAIGLIVAMLVGGVREGLNTRIRSEADIEELLDVPVLGMVQSLPRRTRLVTVGRHERAFGDVYALLAASVDQSLDGAAKATVAVTSALAREGKTSTAANLAVALARRGARVILADFDMRKPTLGDVFSIPSHSPGTLQVLRGSMPLGQALWDVPLNGRSRMTPHTAVPASLHTVVGSTSNGNGGLRVLPAGVLGGSHSMGQAERLPELVAGLKASADVVVLDTPPALVTADMAELARHVDAVLIVTRQGVGTRKSLRRLHRLIRSWPAPTLGAVLTDARLDTGTSYYR
jgi:succinoglycan biosynthesis transport protein ExoP